MRLILLIVFFATCVWARRPFLRPSGDEAEITIETDVIKEKLVENPLNQALNNLTENEDEQADAINRFQFKEEENNPSLVTTIRYT